MKGKNVILLTECVNNGFMRTAGPYRLATEVRKYGYTCQVIDFYTFFTFDEWLKIIDKYVGDETLVVGFSITFLYPTEKDVIDNEINIYDNLKLKFESYTRNELFLKYYSFNFKNFIKLISIFKHKNKNIKFVSGGSSSFIRRINNIEHIDGYADKTFLEYIKKYDTKKIGNYNGEKFDFTKSQILWQPEDHIFKNEALPIEISRGCIFRCKFCSSPEKGKTNFNYIKDPEILKEEFERNYELYGTTNYIFCDDTFNDNIYKLELLYNKIFSKLRFRLNITGYTRLDLINKNKEQLDILNEIGFHHINCGIETINDETQKYIDKILPLEKIKEICFYIKENYPIKISSYIIFGLPYETPQSLEKMYNWLINESLNYFSSVVANPLVLKSISYIDKNKEKLGYYYINDKMGWKNKNNITYKQCFNYSKTINEYVKSKNIEANGFFKMIKENTTNILNSNEKDDIKNLEKIINLYKQKILSNGDIK